MRTLKIFAALIVVSSLFGCGVQIEINDPTQYNNTYYDQGYVDLYKVQGDTIELLNNHVEVEAGQGLRAEIQAYGEYKAYMLTTNPAGTKRTFLGEKGMIIKNFKTSAVDSVVRFLIEDSNGKRIFHRDYNITVARISEEIDAHEVKPFSYDSGNEKYTVVPAAEVPVNHAIEHVAIEHVRYVQDPAKFKHLSYTWDEFLVVKTEAELVRVRTAEGFILQYANSNFRVDDVRYIQVGYLSGKTFVVEGSYANVFYQKATNNVASKSIEAIKAILDQPDSQSQKISAPKGLRIEPAPSNPAPVIVFGHIWAECKGPGKGVGTAKIMNARPPDAWHKKHWVGWLILTLDKNLPKFSDETKYGILMKELLSRMKHYCIGSAFVQRTTHHYVARNSLSWRKEDSVSIFVDLYD